MHQPLQSIQPHRKSNQVRRHHHEYIAHSPNPTYHPISIFPPLPLPFREQVPRQNFGKHEKRDQPPPDQKPELDVMPQRDEREDREHVHYRSCRTPFPLRRASATAAAEGDVDVAHDPAVEAPVPAAPEGERGIIIGHATHHVFRRIDAVDEGPKAEEAPREQQLQPDDVQIEVADHAELEGRVDFPCGLGFGDGDGVDEV